MPALPIVFSDNPILRQKSRRVSHITGEIERLIKDMFESMHAAHGVGLAAVQVGVPLRLIIVEIPEDLEDSNAGTTLVLLNPEVVRASDEMETGIEGCLSVPGWAGEVPRYTMVTVKGMDPKGKKVRLRAEGYLARVLQHEIDHTEGILFIDRASELWPVEKGEEETI